MKVLVCGDRNWLDKDLIFNVLDSLNLSSNDTIIDGHARGADTIAHLYATEKGLKNECFPANWNEFGRSAGPIRNSQMLINGRPDLVIAFHDNLSSSKGTKHMINISRKANVKVRIFCHSGEL